MDTYQKAVRVNAQFAYIFEELVSALVRRKQDITLPDRARKLRYDCIENLQ